VEATDLIKKVRKIEIKTRGLSNHIFAGEYHSAFKGRGMTFSEVREYQYGDSIKQIDWNVTARFNHPYVKIFEEERELTVILLVDVSGSKFFGTNQQLKKDLIAEIAAVLSFSAIQNNDKIGVILFSDKVEKFIPPKKGKKHILRIITELLNFNPQSSGTNITEALRYFTNAVKKKSTAFLISDFIDNNYEQALSIANNKHDIIAVRIFDRREKELPNIGLVNMLDAETNKKLLIDTSNANVRYKYKKWMQNLENELNITVKKAGVDIISVETGGDYIKPLLNLFKRRGAK